MQLALRVRSFRTRIISSSSERLEWRIWPRCLTEFVSWRLLKKMLVERASGVRENRISWGFIKINIKLWKVAKDEQVLSEEQRVRVPTEWCHLRNKQHQQSEYPASQAEKVININSKQNRWEHTTLADAIRDRKLIRLLGIPIILLYIKISLGTARQKFLMPLSAWPYKLNEAELKLELLL